MARDKDEILKEARAVQKELNKLTREGTALTQAQIDKQKELLEKQKELRKEFKTLIQERLDSFKKEEESIGNISSEYDELKKLQYEALSIAASMNNLSDEQLNAITAIQEVNRDISKLSAEEVQSRVALTNQYNDAMEVLKETMHGNSKLVQLLKKQNTLANEFANKTKDENTELEESNKLLDFLKDKFSSVLGIIETMTTGPVATFGLLLVGAGKAINAIGENVREFGGTMDGAVYSTTLLGVVFKDASGVAKGLSKEFGGMKKVTAGMQLDTNLMAINMGISGEEAAKTLGIFSRLNGNSSETAFNLSTSVAALAEANGLNTSQVMEDVSANAEAFALFSRDGGHALGNASIQAAKLGIGLGTMSDIASNLLDFESSITKELELGALLGRNINLNRARQLAAEGKLGAMTKETIKELGGIAEFNAMEYWQRKQTADLLGVSVDELQKMAANMENIDDMGNPLLSKFDRLKEMIKATATGPLGDFVQFLGGGVLAAAQMGGAFAQMGFNVKGFLGKLPLIGKFFGGGGVTPPAPNLPPTPPTPNVNTPTQGPSMGDKLKDLAEGLKAMGTPKVLFGALNLIPTGIGLAAMLVGLPTLFFLSKIDLMKVGVGLAELAIALGFMGTGAVTLGGLNLGVAGIGFAAMTLGIPTMGFIAALGPAVSRGLTALSVGLAELGAAAATGAPFLAVALIGALGLALMTFAYAANMVSPLIESIGNAIGVVLDKITLEKAAAIGVLALSFYGLASSLMFLGSAGLFALPALLGIAAASNGLVLVAELFGLGGSSGETGGIEAGSLSEYESTMLEKMDVLITATTANKDVYLDKDKVTSLIMAKSDKSIINKLNIFNS